MSEDARPEIPPRGTYLKAPRVDSKDASNEIKASGNRVKTGRVQARLQIAMNVRPNAERYVACPANVQYSN